MNLKLRKFLDDVTKSKPVSRHRALVEDRQSEYMHSIFAVDSKVDVDTYTCAVHAFDLIEDPTYLKIANYNIREAFAGKKFVEFVLDNDLLIELADTSQGSGVLVMYFKNNKFEHIGIVNEGNQITSKWGRGLLWKHEIWEVPERYGNEKRFYALPSTCTGLDMFCEYAETRRFHHKLWLTPNSSLVKS